MTGWAGTVIKCSSIDLFNRAIFISNSLLRFTLRWWDGARSLVVCIFSTNKEWAGEKDGLRAGDLECVFHTPPLFVQFNESLFKHWIPQSLPINRPFSWILSSGTFRAREACPLSEIRRKIRRKWGRPTTNSVTQSPLKCDNEWGDWNNIIQRYQFGGLPATGELSWVASERP